MEQPKFIKDFSKQESSEERTKLAREIREKRRTYFEDKSTTEAREQEKSEVVKQIEILQNQIELYSGESFFVKIKDFFAIKKMETELQSQLGKQSSIEDDLSRSISGRPDLEETWTMVADFYANEKKKWAESPYSKEDIVENFTEEHLASLSMDDFTALLKRFPGHMVTHVTRQGVRDQSMPYHNKGEGEGQANFKGMLESKRLLSPLAVAMSESKSFHDICKFFNNGEEVTTYRDSIDDLHLDITDPKRLMNRFKEFTSGNKNEDYHDKAAIHFGIEKVLNSLYGGEKGNDIFIAYPAAHIASQYNFYNKYNGKNLGYDKRDDFRNDLYVWGKNEQDGMNIDAGIIFIPDNAQVDKKTGSQYKLDSEGNPVKIENMTGSNDSNSEFKKSENTITSREYWEQYFSENLEKRPSKIAYYDAGMTPTEALNDWKLKNGITDKIEISDMGLNENSVDHDFKRPGGDAEVAHFRQLALEALKYEYPVDQLLVAYDPEFFSRPKEEQEKIFYEMHGYSAVQA